MKEDLIKLHGIHSCKSNIIDFPYVPNEYMSHFIRGYFAGDGSINYRGYTICFVGGSESFFTSLDEIFSEKGYNTRLKK